MKINRFIALAVIALLVVGAMGAVSMKVFAKGSAAPAPQTQNCNQQDDDAAEVQSAPDTDNIEEQCGDQNDVDTAETIGAVDNDDVQFEEQVGDQNAPDVDVEAPEVEALPVP